MSVATLAAPVRITPGLTLIGDKLIQEINEGLYVVRFARTRQEVDAALRLRFEIFNLELGEGPFSSFLTGQDRDEFDLTSQHLILIDRSEHRVVGTYRLRTYEMAKTIEGFYSSREFDLSSLTPEVLANTIEVDRLCVAKGHRNSKAYMLLWKGLALCLRQSHKSRILGTLSLATQDPMEAGRIFDRLSTGGHLHPEVRIRPKAGFKCYWFRMPEGRSSDVAIPGWFRACLRFGAKLCGPPAINRQFRTINFPVFLDIAMNQKARRSIFGASES
jgi:putative hemolysin